MDWDQLCTQDKKLSAINFQEEYMFHRKFVREYSLANLRGKIFSPLQESCELFFCEYWLARKRYFFVIFLQIVFFLVVRLLMPSVKSEHFTEAWSVYLFSTRKRAVVLIFNLVGSKIRFSRDFDIYICCFQPSSMMCFFN